MSVTVAATAVVVSLLSLYLAARGQRRQWLRESSLDAAQQVLTASFGRRSGQIRELRSQQSADSHLARVRAVAEDAHRSQNDALTRLRLLADSRVVEKAQELHKADDRLFDAASLSAAQSSDGEWAGLQESRDRARLAFIEAVRKSYGLSGAVPIDPLRADTLAS